MTTPEYRTGKTHDRVLDELQTAVAHTFARGGRWVGVRGTFKKKMAEAFARGETMEITPTQRRILMRWVRQENHYLDREDARLGLSYSHDGPEFAPPAAPKTEEPEDEIDLDAPIPGALETSEGQNRKIRKTLIKMMEGEEGQIKIQAMKMLREMDAKAKKPETLAELKSGLDQVRLERKKVREEIGKLDEFISSCTRKDETPEPSGADSGGGNAAEGGGAEKEAGANESPGLSESPPDAGEAVPPPPVPG
jgi:hypothetical protein